MCACVCSCSVECFPVNCMCSMLSDYFTKCAKDKTKQTLQPCAVKFFVVHLIEPVCCSSLSRFIHGVALRRKNQGSNTFRICPPPQLQTHQPCPPPPAPLTPTSGSPRLPSLRLLHPLHPHRHTSATQMSWVRTYCTFYTPMGNEVFLICCFCVLQLLTTQVNAWPTPAPLTPSQPVESSTQLMSRHGSHQGKH